MLTPTTRCNGCSAPIHWARTAKGGKMPLNPEPHPAGNVRVENGVARVLTREELDHTHQEEDLGRKPVALYRSHHATCPKASLYRKSK